MGLSSQCHPSLTGLGVSDGLCECLGTSDELPDRATSFIVRAAGGRGHPGQHSALCEAPQRGVDPLIHH